MGKRDKNHFEEGGVVLVQQLGKESQQFSERDSSKAAKGRES